MTRKRSAILCPRCKQTGSLTKRWVKRTVNIPNIPKPEFATLSSAWDYAARVCLRMRESLILWPPQASADNLSESTYQRFSGFSPLSPDQINAFELRHLSTPSKNARKKIGELKINKLKTTESYEHNSNKLPPRGTIHISLPRNACLITKPSIGWLYGAIVCLVLRDMSKNLPIQNSIIREFSMSIVTVFSLNVNMVDHRYMMPWFELFELSKDVKDGSGHHAASAVSSTSTVLCKECSKNVRKDSSDFVEMEFNPQLQDWKCPRCGGTERLKVRALSPTYIRKIQNKVSEKEKDLSLYLPFFEKVRNTYNYIIGRNKEDFLERFKEYEKLAIRDLLIKKEGYFMVHYDSSKKWNKRSCYIARGQGFIHSNDSRYFSQYMPLINQLARKVNYNKELIDNEDNLLLSLSNELEGIGWPRRHIREKIEADIDHFRRSSF